MAEKEWVSENSSEYEKILLFNDKDHPLMATQAGQSLDMYVYEAYAYVTKGGSVVVGLVPKVQFATNMVDHPMLAGEYVINDIKAVDSSSRPYKYLIDHRSFIDLNTLNHIIDLNRPDLLDPQTVLDNSLNFKYVVNEWAKHNWVSLEQNAKVQALPEGRSDLIADDLPKQVQRHAGFLRTLSEWRDANWITEDQAVRAAAQNVPLVTMDDELSFSSSVHVTDSK